MFVFLGISPPLYFKVLLTLASFHSSIHSLINSLFFATGLRRHNIQDYAGASIAFKYSLWMLNFHNKSDAELFASLTQNQQNYLNSLTSEMHTHLAFVLLKIAQGEGGGGRIMQVVNREIIPQFHSFRFAHIFKKYALAR